MAYPNSYTERLKKLEREMASIKTLLCEIQGVMLAEDKERVELKEAPNPNMTWKPKKEDKE